MTIDGEAGSGKSTAARKLAARLEIPYLDTGAMYRAIAHAALERSVDLSDASALLSLVQSVNLELDCGPTYTRVRVDGRDVSEAIRSMEVSAATSPVAKCQPIRDLLVAQQRALGQRLGSFVTEGRDQGSVVFADAAVKFVLVADVDKRAERRYYELAVDGEESVSLATVRDNLLARDAIDAKQWEPLLKAGRTIVIDTTELTIHDVVDRLVDEIATRQPHSA